MIFDNDDEIEMTYDADQDRMACYLIGIKHDVRPVDVMFDALVERGESTVVGCVVRDYARMYRRVFVEGPFELVPRNGAVLVEDLAAHDLFMARLSDAETAPMLGAIFDFAYRHRLRMEMPPPIHASE